MQRNERENFRASTVADNNSEIRHFGLGGRHQLHLLGTITYTTVALKCQDWSTQPYMNFTTTMPHMTIFTPSSASASH